MKKQLAANAGRTRLRLLGASALMVLLAACGDHPPKDDGDGGEDTPPPSAAITLVAGHATIAGAIDANGGAARFRGPQGITIDSAGNLYVADRGNFTIRKITPNGLVSTLAGSAGNSEFVNGVGGGARFGSPTAIAIAPNNVLYVGDGTLIRSVGTGGQVDTFAQIPPGNNVGNGSAILLDIGGIAVDSRSNVIVTNGHSTRRFATNGATTMLEGTQVLSNVSGTRLFMLRGVAVDKDNAVYVHALNQTISKTNGSLTLTQLAGAPGVRGYADGTGSAAQFEDVVALTVDPQGNLYAADNINNLIRKITPGGVVTTVLGTLKASTLTTGALPGSLPNIGGLTNDGKGTFYATTGNAVIKFTLPP
jgi:serine/threonine-protein kinase